MNARTRRSLSMAQKVLGFSRANPSTDPGYDGVVTRLEKSLGRANALAYEERDSTDEERKAVKRRGTLKSQLVLRLRHLARVGEVAAKDRPELVGVFSLPILKVPNRIFVTAARVQLDRAIEQQELLKQYALGETFVADLTAAVTEFEAAGQVANLGRLSHVGASADLKAASAECRYLIEALDGFNRARFSADQKQLAAWDSAKNIFGPFTRHGDETAPDAVVVPAITEAAA